MNERILIFLMVCLYQLLKVILFIPIKIDNYIFLQRLKKRRREWEEKKKAIGLLMGSLVAHKEKQEKEKLMKVFKFATIGTVVALVTILKFLKLPLKPKNQNETDTPPNTEFL